MGFNWNSWYFFTYCYVGWTSRWKLPVMKKQNTLLKLHWLSMLFWVQTIKTNISIYLIISSMSFTGYFLYDWKRKRILSVSAYLVRICCWITGKVLQYHSIADMIAILANRRLFIDLSSNCARVRWANRITEAFCGSW